MKEECPEISGEAICNFKLTDCFVPRKDNIYKVCHFCRSSIIEQTQNGAILCDFSYRQNDKTGFVNKGFKPLALF